eukprot:3197776-Amphidinium_carterae.1
MPSLLDATDHLRQGGLIEMDRLIMCNQIRDGIGPIPPLLLSPPLLIDAQMTQTASVARSIREHDEGLLH